MNDAVQLKPVETNPPSVEANPLPDQIAILKAEVDALQVHVLKSNKPWYKNHSLWLSLAALSFSALTTFWSNQRLQSEERKAARIELRGLLMRLTQLPREATESWVRMEKPNPLAAGSISSAFNQELTLVSRQAAEVIDRIPEDVTSTERLTVAYALFSSGLSEVGDRQLNAAESIVVDATDHVAVNRFQAQMAFAEGKIDFGREKYRNALQVFAKYPSSNQQYVASTHAHTQMLWSQSEWAQRNCLQAKEHLEAAEAEVSKLVAGPFADGAARQLHQQREIMNFSGCTN